MKQITPYFYFRGNCESAFQFYKSVFGGEFIKLMRYKDLPEQVRGPEKMANNIAHIALITPNKLLLMGNDTTPGSTDKSLNSSIMIDAQDKVEADHLYKMLSQEGRQKLPMKDMFWGAYFGTLDDQFGMEWIITVDDNLP